MSRALCAPGKAPRVVRLLEVVSSEDAVSVAQHTPRQSTGALLYGVLPKTACSVKRGIHQLSTKLPSLLHSSAGRKGAENPSAVPLRGRQGWHWGGTGTGRSAHRAVRDFNTCPFCLLDCRL